MACHNQTIQTVSIVYVVGCTSIVVSTSLKLITITMWLQFQYTRTGTARLRLLTIQLGGWRTLAAMWMTKRPSFSATLPIPPYPSRNLIGTPPSKHSTTLAKSWGSLAPTSGMDRPSFSMTYPMVAQTSLEPNQWSSIYIMYWPCYWLPTLSTNQNASDTCIYDPIIWNTMLLLLI